MFNGQRWNSCRMVAHSILRYKEECEFFVCFGSTVVRIKCLANSMHLTKKSFLLPNFYLPIHYPWAFLLLILSIIQCLICIILKFRSRNFP